MNKKINFEIAKLLDGKNYPFEFATVGGIERVPLNIPTIAEVLMWLYEKHGIWISVQHNIYDKFEEAYSPKHGPTAHDTPTEAYESAIKHILENSI